MARYALLLIVFVPLAAGCGLVPLLNRRSAEESARLTDEARQACERGERKWRRARQADGRLTEARSSRYAADKWAMPHS